MTFKVGLTGGIGSGKTTVANIFKIIGIPVFNADTEAKNLIKTEYSLRNQIISLFGEKAFIGDQYNTKYISEIVFSNQTLLEKLNRIIHPHVYKAFINWCEKQLSAPYLIMEAAILIESGFYKNFDYLIVVSAPEKLRTARINKRDNIDMKNIKARMRMQLSEKQIIKKADFVLKNDNSNLLIPQILEIHHKFVSLQKNN